MCGIYTGEGVTVVNLKILLPVPVNWRMSKIWDSACVIEPTRFMLTSVVMVTNHGMIGAKKIITSYAFAGRTKHEVLNKLVLSIKQP